MTGRPPTCICGSCEKCKRRIAARIRWQSLSMEERREAIARRDPERVKANDRARYYRHRDERLERMKRWAAENPEKAQAGKGEWRKNNREKVVAHSRVAYALRTGKMERGDCEVCGSENTHAHHDDYSKPLDVRWLCPTHHGEVHRRYAA